MTKQNMSGWNKANSDYAWEAFKQHTVACEPFRVTGTSWMFGLTMVSTKNSEEQTYSKTLPSTSISAGILYCSSIYGHDLKDGHSEDGQTQDGTSQVVGLFSQGDFYYFCSP